MILSQPILAGFHRASWLCRLLSFVDMLSYYFFSVLLLSPSLPLQLLSHILSLMSVSNNLLHFLSFSLFSNRLSLRNSGFFLFGFWFFVFVFSNLASLSSHLSSHLLHVKSGQVDFFTFKISTYDLLLIPILWWNYASSHLFSIFFLYFLIHLPDILKCFFFFLLLPISGSPKWYLFLAFCFRFSSYSSTSWYT